MPQYNDMFELSVTDMELIETSLRTRFEALSREEPGSGSGLTEDQEKVLRQIHDLLGRLHNQKVFYRPRDETYVGG